MKTRHLAVLGFVLLLTACSSTPGVWGWYVTNPNTPAGWTNIQFLAGGMLATIQLSLIAAMLSMILGLIVALPGMSQYRLARMPSRVYIEFVRAIPLLPLLFWVFYGLPVVMRSMTGVSVSVDPFWGAVITLVISDSAFTAEIYRAGIQSIPRGLALRPRHPSRRRAPIRSRRRGIDGGLWRVYWGHA